MKSIGSRDIVEVVGVTTIVASLVFVGLQLRQDREVAIVEARAGLTDRVIDLTDLVNNDADLWKRGLDNEELSAADEIRFLGLAKAVRSHLFTQWTRWIRLGPIDPDIAAQNFAFALYSHPGLRRILESEMAYRHDRDSPFGRTTPLNDFDGQVDGHLQELDNSKPTPNRHYVFW